MYRVFAIALLVMASALLVFGQEASGKGQSGGSAQIADALTAKEKQITDALIKKDQKTFDSLVASDAFLAGSQGRMTIADFKRMAFGPDWTLTSSTVEDPQVTMISKDVAILTYKSTGSVTYKGQAQSGTSHATTVWVKRGNNWVAVFHQESDVPPSTAPANPDN